MGHLPHERIQSLHAAAVAAGLTSHQDALLAGLPPALTANLPAAGSPSSRLLQTLHALNDRPALPDGTTPLWRWLRNAEALAATQSEAHEFSAALAALRDERSPASSAADGHAGSVTASRDIRIRLFNVAASKEWTISADAASTLLQVVGELRSAIHREPWRAPGVPRPGAGHQFRLYASEHDRDPLSPHMTVGALASGQPLSLNVEWFKAVRGEPSRTWR